MAFQRTWIVSPTAHLPLIGVMAREYGSPTTIVTDATPLDPRLSIAATCVKIVIRQRRGVGGEHPNLRSDSSTKKCISSRFSECFLFCYSLRTCSVWIFKKTGYTQSFFITKPGIAIFGQSTGRIGRCAQGSQSAHEALPESRVETCRHNCVCVFPSLSRPSFKTASTLSLSFNDYT